jgi:transcriptional regulator with XRE-family HTH domain
MVAEIADLELRYLQKIEAAAQGMSLEALVRLADALDTTPDRLLRPSSAMPRNARRGRPKAKSKR